MIGNTIMLAAGVVGGLAYNESDFVVIMMGMGTVVMVMALIILTLNIWTTAHAGAYAWGVAGAETVSYTHLDVYKRQVTASTASSGWGTTATMCMIPT